MSNFGQAVLTIAGTAVGAAFGNPQLGFFLGSLAGNALFPTKLPGVEGPRLNDLAVQSSAIGVPIARAYGRVALSGNVIWAPPLKEVKSEQQVGGKGGPEQTQTTYSYFASAAIGLCEGPIVGITRVWAGSKLVYDKRDQLPGEPADVYFKRVQQSDEFWKFVTLYVGTETQLADPTIEAVEGIGNVSGYRGLAYVVLTEFPLADFGNVLPQFRFEVYTLGGEVCQTIAYGYDTLGPDYIDAFVPPWDLSVDPPLNTANLHTFTWTGTGIPPATAGPHSTLAAAVAAMNAFRGYSHNYLGWSYSAVNDRPHSRRPDFDPPPSVAREESIFLHYNRFAFAYQTLFSDLTKNTLVTAPEVLGLQLGIGAQGWSHNAPTRTSSTGPGGSNKTFPGYGAWAVVVDGTTPMAIFGEPAGRWDLQGAFTTDSNQNGLADITDGRVYGHGDEVLEVRRAYRYCRELPQPVTVASIVAAECARAGLTSIDVADLEDDLVIGYLVGRVMTARDIVGPLRTYVPFDAVESGTVVRFVQRGKAPVATLTADELAVHASGSSRPLAYEVERTQDVELPREVRVHYVMPDVNHEPGEQRASRLAVRSREIVDVQLAIAMSDDRARQIAEMILFDAWASRRRTPLTLGRSRIALEPTDVVLVPIAGQLERMRLVEDDRGGTGGVLQLQAVYDDDGSFVSYAAGAPAKAPPLLGYFGLTEAVVLDLPALRDADDNAGYYIAVRPFGGTNWRGCSIQRSADGGATYSALVDIGTAATMGTLVTAVPASDPNVEDLGTVIRVSPLAGGFVSTNDAGLDAGQNAIAIGAAGRWEIVQFRTAQFVAGEWRLSGLYRGRRGTEHAIGTSQVEDRVVLLSGGGVARLPLDIADIGRPLRHRAVTFGTTVEEADIVQATPAGVALKPFSPVHLTASRNGGGDLTLAWTRRNRIGKTLPNGTPVLLSEQSEAYDVAILNGATELRVLQPTAPTVVYTAAQQVTDFGSAQASVSVRIYQRSAVVGRGYPLAGTV